MHINRFTKLIIQDICCISYYASLISVLDSKTITRQTPSGGKWIDFNILPAVRAWSKSGSSKNSGIFIEVKTIGGDVLVAESVFRRMNCTDSKCNT